MPKVEIYTTPMCPFCWSAKKLLDSKNVTYEEINLWTQGARRQEMVARADGRSTVPQIFIDDQGIGGSDELTALDQSGELDRLLAEA
jgi:glutaredoxin 3